MIDVMNKKPLVSVVINTYNQEKYIGRALDSLVSQVCDFDYEILLTDDCSKKDNTPRICKEYAERYPDKIRLFLNERNKGIIMNYYDTIAECRGKYICDCGGDDYWIDNHKLQKQVDIFNSYPKVSMVCANLQNLDNESGKISSNVMKMDNDIFDGEIYGKGAVISYINGNIKPVVLSASCFRKDILDSAFNNNRELFTGEGIICEDFPITLFMLQSGPLYYMKDEVMVYRVLKNSVSHNDDMHEYMKGFSWTSFRQIYGLAMSFEAENIDIKPFIDKYYKDFIYTAFLFSDKEWMKDIVDFAKKNRIKLTHKQYLQYFLSGFKPAGKYYRNKHEK